MQGDFQVSLSARGLPLKLGVVVAILVVVHVAMWSAYFSTAHLRGHEQVTSLFDLDTEMSFGNWFSSAVLLLGGLLTLVCAAGRPIADQRWNAWWWILGGWMMILSMEEVAGIHESLNSEPAFRAFWGQWAVPGAILALVVCLAFVPFLMMLPGRTRRWLIASAIIYFAGAVGVELATVGYEQRNELGTLAYNVWNGVEEGLEMTGVILYLYTVLDYMADHATGRVSIGVGVRR